MEIPGPHRVPAQRWERFRLPRAALRLDATALVVVVVVVAAELALIPWWIERTYVRCYLALQVLVPVWLRSARVRFVRSDRVESMAE